MRLLCTLGSCSVSPPGNVDPVAHRFLAERTTFTQLAVHRAGFRRRKRISRKKNRKILGFADLSEKVSSGQVSGETHQ